MGQLNLAPFLVRYIKLIATAVFIIVVWSLVDRNVEPTTPADHTSRSLHPETPLVEVSTLPEEIPQDEIQYHETEFAPSPDVPHQWTEVNSTLGFGTILAVSHTSSKRKAGLLWAANMTGIDIEIPDQPEWSEDDLISIRKGKDRWVNKGSALAWLGHRNALKKFLSTPHETALILEDDADWDIAFRSTEVPLAAAAIRQLFDPTPPPPSNEPKQFHHQHHMHSHGRHASGTTSSTDPNYWGPTSEWEILHLGHSDSEQYDRENGATLARIHSNPFHSYADASLPGPERLNPATTTLLYSLGVPLTSRLWHRSHWPLGSYAYGITRAAAERILAYASPTADAFDVVLLEVCRDHKWKCWTLEPGLVGEYYTPSEIARQNMPAAEREKVVQEELYDTWNLRCAVRQRALWVEEGDEMGRQGMIDRVRKGECPAYDVVEPVVESVVEAM